MLLIIFNFGAYSPFEEIERVITFAKGSAYLRDNKISFKFLSAEERYRQLRMNMMGQKLEFDDGESQVPTSFSSTKNLETVIHQEKETYLNVNIVSKGPTMFFEVSELKEVLAPYRIWNKSSSHIISYRQKGCTGYQWNRLEPNKSKIYVLEDPMMDHKLSVWSLY